MLACNDLHACSMGLVVQMKFYCFILFKSFIIMVCKPCSMSYKSDSSYSKSVSIKLVCVFYTQNPAPVFLACRTSNRCFFSVFNT